MQRAQQLVSLLRQLRLSAGEPTAGCRSFSTALAPSFWNLWRSGDCSTSGSAALSNCGAAVGCQQSLGAAHDLEQRRWMAVPKKKACAVPQGQLEAESVSVRQRRGILWCYANFQAAAGVQAPKGDAKPAQDDSAGACCSKVQVRAVLNMAGIVLSCTLLQLE